MSPDKLAGDGKLKALVLGVAFVLALATLIVYSPSLGQLPLFDESFLVAWLSHCLKAGLATSDTTAYLLAPAADPRDGLTVLGSGYVLLLALLTGSGYSTMRFLQVLLHLANALLLLAAGYGALRLQGTEVGAAEKQGTQAGATEKQGTIDGEQKNHGNKQVPDPGHDQAQEQVLDQDQKLGPSINIRAFAVAAVAALYFCLFPLAPEAVAWLFGLPIELATSFMLAASVILVWQGGDNLQNKKRLVIVATVLGVVAPWISLKGALLVNLPIVLIVCFEKAGQGIKSLFKDPNLKPVLLSLALMIASSVPAEIISFSNYQAIPEAIKQLTIEKISLTGDSDPNKGGFLDSGPGANIQALSLPVNRNIDERYNKVLRLLYLFLPLPVVLFLAAALTNSRFRILGVATIVAAVAWALGTSATVNGQSFYGARWLYPILPTVCLLWALLCISPLFVDLGKRVKSSHETAEMIIKVGLCVIFVFSLSFFFFQRTYRQTMSYKSNGKLWKVIKESITIAGQKQTSPFIIVRNLPQSLSIAPILSPFSPQLIDTQSGLPRTASLSAGRLKEALRSGKYAPVTLHYEKQWNGFVATDLAIVNKPWGPVMNAKQIADKLSPPIIFYHGAVKLDEKQETLLMESHTRVGPAMRIECYGLSPIQGDFLYVEAKIDVPQAARTSGPAQLELHWLTNWLGDWEARDRRVITTGPVSDGQFHRYYFPLRTLAWTTSGLPSHIMLGFPGGATVALKSIGLCQEPVPLPEISVATVHKQDTNKNYFSHYCFDYPDIDELGLCAIYGKDNALDITFDVSNIPGAKEALIEIVPLSEAFRNENSSEPLAGSRRISSNQIKGNIKVPAEQLGGGGLFSVRVFGASEDHKIIGHASDSLKCLVDQQL